MVVAQCCMTDQRRYIYRRASCIHGRNIVSESWITKSFGLTQQIHRIGGSPESRTGAALMHSANDDGSDALESSAASRVCGLHWCRHAYERQ